MLQKCRKMHGNARPFGRRGEGPDQGLQRFPPGGSPSCSVRLRLVVPAPPAKSQVSGNPLGKIKLWTGGLMLRLLKSGPPLWTDEQAGQHNSGWPPDGAAE